MSLSPPIAPNTSHGHPDAHGHVWTSARSIQIPTADILTFAFANLSDFDNECPIFIDANDPSNCVSARQAFQTVLQLIKGLKELGLKEGECVCLHAYNNIWYPLIWLGVIGSGGRVSGSNPRYTQSELVHQLKLTKPRFIFAQVGCIDSIIEAASQCNIPASNIFFIDPRKIGLLENYQNWRTLLIDCECEWTTPKENGENVQDRIAMYGMTSGTTGLPKAAMISHRYVVAQTALLEDQFQGRPYRPSQLICLPVFHAFASPLALVLPLRLGLPTFFLPKWSEPDFLRTVSSFSITDVPVAPAIVGALTQLPPSEHRLLKSLRYVISAGAPLPESVQNRLYGVLDPQATISQCWGTTEAAWHTLFNWQEKDTSGSVGRLLPNVHMKLIDDDGHHIAQDEKFGEAFVRTPMMFSGYLENPEASKGSFDSEGFYRTGDRLYVRHGKLYYGDRIKETMKVRGWQVSPTELESTLIQHPRISDVAVLGVVKNNDLGLPETFPAAYVVRTSGQGACLESELPPLTEQEVVDFVASKFISYKQLTGGVVFVKQIPRSLAGKILRRNLPEAELDR